LTLPNGYLELVMYYILCSKDVLFFLKPDPLPSVIWPFEQYNEGSEGAINSSGSLKKG
jgi:hypothetical protein